MKLRDYQEDITKRGLEILTNYHVLYLAMEMRTGKTITSLSIAERYGADNILFVSKKKALQSIIDDHKKMGFKSSLFAINYESLHKIPNINWSLVIIDEAHSLGAFPKPSKRTKQLKKICAGKPIILMSGTPSPESWSQLYHSFCVSSFSPFNGYKNFYRWAKDYVNVGIKYIRSMPINDYTRGKKDKILKKIDHLKISFSQKDAGFDVSEVDEQILICDMPWHLSDMSAAISKKNIYRYSRGLINRVVTTNSGADVVNKLSQIAGGTMIFNDDKDGTILSEHKAEFIKERFKGKKIAILYKYRAEFDILKKHFKNYTTNPELFNSELDRTFISQVVSAREGVNLSSADALVMYNIDFSATSYWQARARLQHKDRTRAAKLYWIFNSGGVEFEVMEAVKNKRNFTWTYYKEQMVNDEVDNKFNGFIKNLFE